MKPRFTVSPCKRCSQLHLYARCERKNCTAQATRIRFVRGNMKGTCDKHTPCCRGKSIITYPETEPENRRSREITGSR